MSLLKMWEIVFYFIHHDIYWAGIIPWHSVKCCGAFVICLGALNFWASSMAFFAVPLFLGKFQVALIMKKTKFGKKCNCEIFCF